VKVKRTTLYDESGTTQSLDCNSPSKAVWAPLIFVVVIDVAGEVEEVVNAGKNLAKDDVYGSDVAAAIMILLLPKRIEYSNRIQGLKVGVEM
jgi:hypothetical protein